MEEILQLTQSIGFPIVLSVYLLGTFGKKIDDLNESINNLSIRLDKLNI